jgi:hypothetical protein
VCISYLGRLLQNSSMGIPQVSELVLASHIPSRNLALASASHMDSPCSLKDPAVQSPMQTTKYNCRFSYNVHGSMDIWIRSFEFDSIEKLDFNSLRQNQSKRKTNHSTTISTYSSAESFQSHKDGMSW